MTKRFTVDPPGPLVFPVTPFRADGKIDDATFTDHLRWLLEFEPPALFVACGTGEFASLDVDEVGALISLAVEVAGDVPVYAGTGGALPLAKRYAAAAQRAGAVGLLALPPYLVSPEQAGLEAYYRELAASTSLDLIVYQRDNAVFTPATVKSLSTVENIVGFKDGLGDVELMQRIVRAVGSELTYFNGLPTAEASQLSYLAIGVDQYSSAVFNFVPEVSWAFHRALVAGDSSAVARILDEFFIPLTDLRRSVKGYAVTLVKAGVSLRRGAAAGARAPLVDARPEHRAELARIIEAGLAAVTS